MVRFLRDFFLRPSYEVAPDLIGRELLVNNSGGIIVETEAYELLDPASHSYKGPNRKNAAMFGSSGSAYIYRSYGIHWCFNIVCLPGSTVLVRAIHPVTGVLSMQKRRNQEGLDLLCSGPGRLCQALGIDGSMNGLSLENPPFRINFCDRDEIFLEVGSRVGISRALDKPWRFGLSGSLFLSRKF